MSAFTVRAATPEDAAGIASVQIATWRSIYRGIVDDQYIESLTARERESVWRERLEGITVSRPAIFLAEAPGEGPVGYVAGGPARDNLLEYEAEIYSMYVLPAWQGKGVGRSLLSSLLATARSLRYLNLMVHVLAENPSRRFFEQLGGKLIGEGQRRIGGRDYPEVIYGWESLDSVKL